MTWAGRDRALPPEMMPAKLFDRLFGARDSQWINRKRSILDAVREDAKQFEKRTRRCRTRRVSMNTCRPFGDVERTIASLPPEYHRIDPPEVEDIAEGLAEDRAPAERSSRPRARHRPDARRFVAMLTRVSGTVPLPVVGLHVRATSRLHSSRRQGSGRGRVPDGPTHHAW